MIAVDDLTADLRGVPSCHLLQHRRANTGQSLADQVAVSVDDLDRIPNREIAGDPGYAHREQRAPTIPQGRAC